MTGYSNDIMALVAEDGLSDWDIEPVGVKLVSRTENVVYRVDCRDLHSYALRIHRPGYHTLAELESESMWTTALNDAGTGVPVAVPTKNGAHFAEIGVPGTSESRLLGLIPWFEGSSMDVVIDDASDQSRLEASISRLGQLLADMHNQASGWRPPRGFERHSFDADGLMGEQPLWGRFWAIPELTLPQKQLLAAARSRVFGCLQDIGQAPAIYSMIHADLRAANVLVSGEHVFVIDFDDAGFGWHHHDVAVALSDFVGRPNFASIQEALIRGYRTRRSLSADDVSLLPMFLGVRAMMLLGWLHDRPEIDHYRLLPEFIESACQSAEVLLES